jgi:hypothetical protein
MPHYLLLFLGQWVSTALGETHGSINVEMMAKFRNGSYDSQDECTKAAWLFFATKLMAAVNPTWKPSDCVRNQFLSKQTTPSDEAFAMWVLAHYGRRWEEDRVEDEARKVGGEPPKKRYKRAGTSISTRNLADFYAKKNDVVQKRLQKKGWEEAVKAKANEEITGRVRLGTGGLPSVTDESEAPTQTEEEYLTAALPNGITWSDMQIEV